MSFSKAIKPARPAAPVSPAVTIGSPPLGLANYRIASIAA
jgi:hypothetical protein